MSECCGCYWHREHRGEDLCVVHGEGGVLRAVPADSMIDSDRCKARAALQYGRGGRHGSEDGRH